MHELGNPLHVYDADQIPGKTLTARLARDGETITTLDDKERTLTGDMLVIADADGPSGIAGVMGGAASEITETTTRVVLEAACFERGGIQRTSKTLGLRTDGSNRWEKGVSPHLAPIASIRAAQLLVEWSGGQMLGDPEDAIVELPSSDAICLRAARVQDILGMDVGSDETVRILSGLGFHPVQSPTGWDCTVPSWRWLDATREIDLIEEIGRVYGLRNVPVLLPRIPAGLGGLTADQRIRRRIEDHLAGAGLREAVTISLGDPTAEPRLRVTGVESLVLRNPLSADLSELRTSLVPGLLEVVLRNRAVGEEDVQIFEIGRTYRAGGAGGLAIEEPSLGIAIAGRLGGAAWPGPGVPCDFSALASIVDALFARLGVSAVRRTLADVSSLHPGRAAEVVADGGGRIGVMGELHPALASTFELDGPVSIAEFDLTALVAAVPEAAAFAGLSLFPAVRQDIAVLVSASVPSGELVQTAYEAGGELLQSVEVFDVFSDTERIGAGRVSIALHLVFQAHDRTLTEDEATEAREAIVTALHASHAADLRA
jgi:phenylalanyl-tRNA synthetase beta chain